MAPTRQGARRAVTEARVLDAAAAVVRERGWDQVSFSAVAAAAGLSTRPLYDRYPDRSALGVALWESGPAAALGAAITAVCAAVRSAPEVSSAALAAAYGEIALPQPPLDLAVDLAAASVVDEQLRDAVSASVRSALPGLGSDPVTDAGTIAILVSALGLLLASRRSFAPQANLEPFVAELRHDVAHPREAVPLPEVDVPHMKDPVVPADDPTLSALLTATLRVVSERGYHAATTSRIVSAAGVSEGLLYGRYESKLDLVLDATNRSLAYAFELNMALTERLTAELGPNAAEGVVYREVMRPEHAPARMLTLEQLRLSWHEPRMRAHTEAAEREVLAQLQAAAPLEAPALVASRVHWGLSLGFGSFLTAVLLPEVWSLPFDTVVHSDDVEAG